MAKIKPDVLSAKLSRVQRGVYWFGLIGRLSMFAGVMLLMTGVCLTFLGTSESLMARGPECFGEGLTYLLTGWLFLMGRDAFAALRALISEMEDVV